MLCVLLTAWFDEFVDSVAAICVALRCQLSVYVLLVTCRFRRRQRRIRYLEFGVFSSVLLCLEFNSGKLAV